MFDFKLVHDKDSTNRQTFRQVECRRSYMYKLPDASVMLLRDRRWCNRRAENWTSPICLDFVGRTKSLLDIVAKNADSPPSSPQIGCHIASLERLQNNVKLESIVLRLFFTGVVVSQNHLGRGGD